MWQSAWNLHLVRTGPHQWQIAAPLGESQVYSPASSNHPGPLPAGAPVFLPTPSRAPWWSHGSRRDTLLEACGRCAVRSPRLDCCQQGYSTAGGGWASLHREGWPCQCIGLGLCSPERGGWRIYPGRASCLICTALRESGVPSVGSSCQVGSTLREGTRKKVTYSQQFSPFSNWDQTQV